MVPGLRITILDQDPEYLGLEVAAASARFAGTTKIYADLGVLKEFANEIAGFPRDASDRRSFDFGVHDERYAGGHMRLSLRCLDGSGRAEIDVAVQDDRQANPDSVARFRFAVEPAELDRFVQRLRDLEESHNGQAFLAAV
jgi:hypothetical protein